VKIIKKLTKDEFKKAVPKGLGDALFNPKDVFYCDICDGLRNKEHKCVDI
jgi:thioredoxin reductase